MFLQRRIAKRKEKELIRSEYHKSLENLSRLFRGMNNLVYLSRKCKILKGETFEETERLYSDFYRSMKRDGFGDLGSVWNLDPPIFHVSDNGVFVTVEYSIFELKDGVSMSDYQKIAHEYEELSSEHRRLQEKYYSEHG